MRRWRDDEEFGGFDLNTLNSPSWNGSLSAHTVCYARHFGNKRGLSLDEGSVISLLVRNHFLLDGPRVVPGTLLCLRILLLWEPLGLDTFWLTCDRRI